MQQTSTIVFDIENQGRTFSVFFMLSLLGHLCLFGVAAWVHLPDYSMMTFREPAAISVDLVAFNPNPPRATMQTTPSQAVPVETVASVEPYVEPDPISVKTAIQDKVNPSDFIVKAPEVTKTKKSLKTQTLVPEKVLETAVRRMEKQTQTATSQPLSDRIVQLRREVGEYSGSVGQGQSRSPGGSQALGGIGLPSRRQLEQIEIFQAEVSVRLKNNWVFSEELAGDTRGLESRLVIKIMPNGSITDVWFEKRSGNVYLDSSAHKTVMKSNPLPPLPAGYAYYHLVVGFTPSGIY